MSPRSSGVSAFGSGFFSDFLSGFFSGPASEPAAGSDFGASDFGASDFGASDFGASGEEPASCAKAWPPAKAARATTQARKRSVVDLTWWQQRRARASSEQERHRAHRRGPRRAPRPA